MPKISSRKFVLILVVLGFVSLICFTCLVPFREPTPEEAYERIFGEPPPSFVRDLRMKYYTHLKGYGIYLGFRAEPEQVKKILGFDPVDALPLYWQEYDHLDHWEHESVFRELYPKDFPDLKTLTYHWEERPGEYRKFVMAPDTGYVFCYRLLDSDIDSEND